MNINTIIKREFVAKSRYGYGAIDEYVTDLEGNCVLLRNVFSGTWLTQKASKWIADAMNTAYYNGKNDFDNAIKEHLNENKSTN